MASFYQTYAADYMTISEDEQGLFCSVPSERDINVKYIVRCDEHKDSVEVVSCNCVGHSRWGHCKHADICKAFWARIYKSNQAKLAAKAEQEAAAAVAEAEKIVATPVIEAPKLTNPFKKPRKYVTELIEKQEHKASVLAEMREIKERREYAPLNGNRAFSILR